MLAEEIIAVSSCFFFCCCSFYFTLFTVKVHRYKLQRNLNSTVPVDVVWAKSYVNSLFNSTRLPVGVSVNKLNFVPRRKYITPVIVDGEEGAYWKKYSILNVIASVVDCSRKTFANFLFLNLFLEL